MEKRQRLYTLLSGMATTREESVARSALGLLKRIAENICANPSDERFRTLRRGNATLASRLFVSPEVDHVLGLVGFHEAGEAFAFEGENLTALDDLLVIIEGVEVEMDTRSHNANLDPGEVQRRQVAAEAEAQVRENEIRRIAAQAQGDRREVQSDLSLHPPRASQAQSRNFGATVKTCSDLGIGKSNNR